MTTIQQLKTQVREIEGEERIFLPVNAFLCDSILHLLASSAFDAVHDEVQ